MAPVGRVDVDQDRAHPRGRVLQQHPLGAVRRPDADPVPGLDPGREQSDGNGINICVQLLVGPPPVGRDIDQGLLASPCRSDPAQVLADGLAQQREGRDSVAVGQLSSTGHSASSGVESHHRPRSGFWWEAPGTPADPQWCARAGSGVTVKETCISCFPRRSNHGDLDHLADRGRGARSGRARDDDAGARPDRGRCSGRRRSRRRRRERSAPVRRVHRRVGGRARTGPSDPAAAHQAAAAPQERYVCTGRAVGSRRRGSQRPLRAGKDRRRALVLTPLRRDPDHTRGLYRRRISDRGRNRPRASPGVAVELAVLIVAVVIVALMALAVMKTVRIVPQARARNIERFGRYRKTLEPGMNFIIPFVDRVKPLIDLREQVVAFKGQPVITEDNLVVLIDTVLFSQVTDLRAADYEIVNYIQAIEQITATMLRSVIGSMDLEQTLTSRDKINTLLRGVLDDASGKWGIRVTRVEIKAIDPPKSVIDAMEKQMRAEREKRAAILNAEGVRQSKILTAEGEKQSQILRAEGDKQGQILRSEGQAQAIGTVFQAVHDGDADPQVLAYQYLQTLPQLAQAEGNTFWVIPSEVTTALRALSTAFGSPAEGAGTQGGVGSAGVPGGRAVP